MKSKKAQFFTVFVVVMAAGALSTAFFMIGSKLEQFKEPIGTNAFEITMLAQENEKAMIYLDYSAKTSAWKSVWDLADKGGITKESNKGEYLGYKLWKETPPNLFGPSFYKEEFIKLTEQNLNQLIKNPNKQKENIKTTPLTSVNIDYYHTNNEYITYDLLLKDNFLIGSADIPLFSFSKKSIKQSDGTYVDRVSTSYTIIPSFNVDLNYDITEYKEISTQAQRLVEECSSENTNNTLNCVNANKPKTWKIGACNDEIHEQKFFYDFVNFYDTCLNSKNDSCYCVKTLDYSSNKIVKEENYVIKLIQQGNHVHFNQVNPEGPSQFIYSTQLYSQKQGQTKQKRKVLFFEAEYGDEGKIGGTVDKDDDVCIGWDTCDLEDLDCACTNYIELNENEKHRVILYKSGNEITFVDNEAYPSTAKQCEQEAGKIIRFCADSKYTLPYNNEDTMELRNLKYKFALDFN